MDSLGFKSLSLASLVLFSSVLSANALSDTEIRDIVVLHNTYRCMHGLDKSQFVSWAPCMADVAQDYSKSNPKTHSNSYKRTGCPGPAGENLAWGYQNIGIAIDSWYSEVTNWAAGKQPSGHFTAMTWKGVKTIGCGITGTSYVCNYKGGDVASCNTPNMASCYEAQVPPVDTSKTKDSCRKIAEAAYDGDSSGGDNGSGGGDGSGGDGSGGDGSGGNGSGGNGSGGDGSSDGSGDGSGSGSGDSSGSGSGDSSGSGSGDSSGSGSGSGGEGSEDSSDASSNALNASVLGAVAVVSGTLVSLF